MLARDHRLRQPNPHDHITYHLKNIWYEFWMRWNLPLCTFKNWTGTSDRFVIMVNIKIFELVSRSDFCYPYLYRTQWIWGLCFSSLPNIIILKSLQYPLLYRRTIRKSDGAVFFSFVKVSIFIIH